LEALIRLCQARAKACLRDFVLREDALDVVELMSQSVEQVHSDEGGVIDKARGGAGGRSNRKTKKAFIKELQRITGNGGECSLDDLVSGLQCLVVTLYVGSQNLSHFLSLGIQRRVAEKVGCGLNDFDGFIEDLRNGGLLLRKTNGKYQVA